VTRFPATTQTVPKAHTFSPIIGTGFLSRGAGSGLDHQLTSSSKVKERVELYVYSSSGSSWPVLGRTSLLPSTLPLLCYAVTSFSDCHDDEDDSS